MLKPDSVSQPKINWQSANIEELVPPAGYYASVLLKRVDSPLSDRDFGQWRKSATVAQPQLKRATKIRSSGQKLIDAGSEA
jgi:hypothetical protein